MAGAAEWAEDVAKPFLLNTHMQGPPFRGPLRLSHQVLSSLWASGPPADPSLFFHERDENLGVAWIRLPNCL